MNKQRIFPLNNGQYYKKNVNCGIFEIVDALDIDKVKLSFMKYDKNREQGNKITQKIDIHMAPGKFLSLCHMLKPQIITERITINGKSYAKESTKSIIEQRLETVDIAFEDYGGKRDQNGQIRCRRFTIEKSNKPGAILFKAQEGPGKTTKTGGYVFAGKADVILLIPIEVGSITQSAGATVYTESETTQIAMMGEAMINAYMAYSMNKRKETVNKKNADITSYGTYGNIPSATAWDISPYSCHENQYDNVSGKVY